MKFKFGNLTLVPFFLFLGGCLVNSKTPWESEKWEITKLIRVSDAITIAEGKRGTGYNDDSYQLEIYNTSSQFCFVDITYLTSDRTLSTHRKELEPKSSKFSWAYLRKGAVTGTGCGDSSAYFKSQRNLKPSPDYDWVEYDELSSDQKRKLVWNLGVNVPQYPVRQYSTVNVAQDLFQAVNSFEKTVQDISKPSCPAGYFLDFQGQCRIIETQASTSRSTSSAKNSGSKRSNATAKRASTNNKPEMLEIFFRCSRSYHKPAGWKSYESPTERFMAHSQPMKIQSDNVHSQYLNGPLSRFGQRAESWIVSRADSRMKPANEMFCAYHIIHHHLSGDPWNQMDFHRKNSDTEVTLIHFSLE